MVEMKTCFPIDVKPLDDYRLLVTFDNLEKRIFDVAPYLDDSFFAPLRNIGIFNSVKINPLTIEWANGIDICPDELYSNSTPVLPSCNYPSGN
jgi:hypothetical protein